MSSTTTISWSDATWNCIWGCSHVSEGCRHCYAEGIDRRQGNKLPWTAPNAAKNVRLLPRKLGLPLHWRKPRLVFVNSMSDCFHEQVPDEFLDRMFAVIQACPQHAFQILTKRPERMLEYMKDAEMRVCQASENLAAQMEWCHANEDEPWPPKNAWLGVSVEDQKNADHRIPLLLQTPASVRFLSCEPLLGPLDILRSIRGFHEKVGDFHPVFAGKGGIDWCIVGGESGPGYRPMALEWAEDILRQCQRHGVAFFMKQNSGRYPGDLKGVPDHMLVRQFPQAVTA